MTLLEVAVIGGGPAGLAAGMQLIRQGVDCLVFEGARLGGMLHNANLIENYPGFPKGIKGPRLVQLILRQAQSLGVPIVTEQVRAQQYAGNWFHLAAQDRMWRAQFVILASGTKPRRLAGWAPSDRLYYEVAPLLDLRGQRVTIIGAGDAAFDYALNLARRNQVVVLNRSHRTRCLGLLEVRATGQPGITYLPDTTVHHVEEQSDGSLRLECISGGKKRLFLCDYLVAAIGREANLDCLAPPVLRLLPQLEAQGRLYRVGDVNNGLYRQTAIAVGQGIEAAMKIQTVLQEKS